MFLAFIHSYRLVTPITDASVFFYRTRLKPEHKSTKNPRYNKPGSSMFLAGRFEGHRPAREIKKTENLCQNLVSLPVPTPTSSTNVTVPKNLPPSSSILTNPFRAENVRPISFCCSIQAYMLLIHPAPTTPPTIDTRRPATEQPLLHTIFSSKTSTPFPSLPRQNRKPLPLVPPPKKTTFPLDGVPPAHVSMRHHSQPPAKIAGCSFLSKQSERGHPLIPLYFG